MKMFVILISDRQKNEMNASKAEGNSLDNTWVTEVVRVMFGVKLRVSATANNIL